MSELNVGAVTVTFNNRVYSKEEFKAAIDRGDFKGSVKTVAMQVYQQEFGKGTTVQSADAAPLTEKQKAAKAAANAAQQQEIADAKAAAKERVKKEGVKTEYGELTSYQVISKDKKTGEEKTATTFTFDIKAPTRKKEKSSRGAVQARMARYYDEKSGQWIELQEGESMKDLNKRLKAKEKELKAEKKAAKKQLKSDAKAGVSDKQLTNDYLRKDKTTEEYDQVKQARKASAGKGIKTDSRAHNRNVKANNRLVDREVFFDKADAKAASESHEAKGRTIKVASKDDIAVLHCLAATAQRHLDSNESSPQEKALWTELANLFKDENGNEIKQPDTRKVQDALIDLTGGDMRLNYTEQKTISKELGVSMSDVRSLFKTYGFEAPNPIGKRVTNGLIAAAPATGAVTMSWLLSRTNLHAEATAEAHAHAEATAIARAEATAEATTEGIAFDWTDPYTGEEIHKRVAGDVQTVTAYAEAIETAVADNVSTATAVVDTVVGLSKKALVAAPTIAFLAGFAKKPVEISAAQQGVDAKKLATFVEVYKGNGNKNIGNQIVQMAGQITGNKAVDRALIVAVLDHDIGSQNTNPRTRELENALAHLDAIKAEVDKFKKLPKPEPDKPPVQEPSPSPQPTVCPIDLDSVPKTYPYKRKAGDTWAGLVKAYYPDCLTGDSKHTMSECIRELKRQLAYDDDGNFHQDLYTSLLKGNDLPKEMKLPEKIYDCDIHKDAKVKAEKFDFAKNRGKVLDKAGRTYNQATMQSCKDNEPTNVPEGTSITKPDGKTFKVINGKWVEQK